MPLFTFLLNRGPLTFTWSLSASCLCLSRSTSLSSFISVEPFTFYCTSCICDSIGWSLVPKTTLSQISARCLLPCCPCNRAQSLHLPPLFVALCLFVFQQLFPCLRLFFLYLLFNFTPVSPPHHHCYLPAGSPLSCFLSTLLFPFPSPPTPRVH